MLSKKIREKEMVYTLDFEDEDSAKKAAEILKEALPAYFTLKGIRTEGTQLIVGLHRDVAAESAVMVDNILDNPEVYLAHVPT